MPLVRFSNGGSSEWKAIIVHVHYGSGSGNRGILFMHDYMSDEIATIYDQAGGISAYRAGTTNISFKMPYGGNTYVKIAASGDLYYFPNGSGGISTPTYLQAYTAGTQIAPGIDPEFTTSTGYADYYLGLK